MPWITIITCCVLYTFRPINVCRRITGVLLGHTLLAFLNVSEILPLKMPTQRQSGNAFILFWKIKKGIQASALRLQGCEWRWPSKLLSCMDVTMLPWLKYKNLKSLKNKHVEKEKAVQQELHNWQHIYCKTNSGADYYSFSKCKTDADLFSISFIWSTTSKTSNELRRKLEQNPC